MAIKLVCLIYVVLLFTLVCANSHTGECKEPRIRRPWRLISNTEKSLYLEAILTAKQNGIYDRFTAIHKSALNTPYSHGSSLFLPWHRWFLFQFENILRSLHPKFKCVTIPYWDWERDAGKEAKSTVFNAHTLGASIESNVTHCVRDGLFSQRMGWVVDDRCLNRQFDPKIAFLGEIGLMALISTRQFGNFSVDFEARAHGAPHAWLNGDMGDFTSPNDPMFFLHHSNIDRLWAMYQDCHDYDKIKYSNVRKNVKYMFYSKTKEFGDILDPMPYYFLNGKAESMLFVPGKQVFPSPRDTMQILDNPFLGMHYAYDPADNLVALFEKFNGKICNWDWFLGPPNHQNKQNWGLKWLHRLRHPPRRIRTTSIPRNPSMTRPSVPGNPRIPSSFRGFPGQSPRIGRVGTVGRAGWNPTYQGGANAGNYHRGGNYRSGNYQGGDYRSGNYQGENYRGNYQNGNRYQGGNYQGRNFQLPNLYRQSLNLQNGNFRFVNFLGGRFPMTQIGNFQRGNYQGGNYQGGNYQGGNYQGGNYRQTGMQAGRAVPNQRTVSVPVADFVGNRGKRNVEQSVVVPPSATLSWPFSVTHSIPPSGQYTLKWKYLNNSHIRVRVESGVSGWVAVGFGAESHGMDKCDMVIMSGDPATGRIFIGDYFSQTFGYPVLDSDQTISDASGSIGNSGSWMEFTRPLKSSDQLDKEIVTNGKNTISWAFGNSPIFTKHEPQSRGAVSLFFQSFEDQQAILLQIRDDQRIQESFRNSNGNSDGNSNGKNVAEPQFPKDGIVRGYARLAPEFRVSWRIVKEIVTFTVVVTPPTKTFSAPAYFPQAGKIGWIGIGFGAEDGGHKNADMIIGNVINGTVSDYISMSYVAPYLDKDVAGSNDLLSSSLKTFQNGTIKMVFSRYLNTNDPSDKPIKINALTDIVWAYGPKGAIHWPGARGSASLNLYGYNKNSFEKCKLAGCLRGQGRCNVTSGFCDCFTGWTGKKCEKPAAYPDIAIRQNPNTQLRDSVNRLRFKNGGSKLPQGFPGNRHFAYVWKMMARAYFVFADKPSVGAFGGNRLWLNVLERNSITKTLSAKDKLSLLLLGECALTANGKQYISPDWMAKSMNTVSPSWNAPCPTTTCCNSSTMMSQRLVCSTGGIAQPICDPQSCKWRFDCQNKVNIIRGVIPENRFAGSYYAYRQTLPRMSQLRLFQIMARLPKPNVTSAGRFAGLRRPGMSRPGISRPGATRPGVSRPGVARPGISRPGVVRPGTGASRPTPDTSSIQGVRTGTFRPVMTKPGVSRPAGRPGTRPISRPGVARPGISRPGVARPGVSRPTTRPVISRPTVVRNPTQRPQARPTVVKPTSEKISQNPLNTKPKEAPLEKRPARNDVDNLLASPVLSSQAPSSSSTPSSSLSSTPTWAIALIVVAALVVILVVILIGILQKWANVLQNPIRE